MSHKNYKLLRKSAKKFNIPFEKVKFAFKKASPEARKRFLINARKQIDLI